MAFSNILSVAIATIGKISNEVQLDWLGNIIKSLIEGFGSIGVGIIVFTLILKMITLPFDIFSRVSTKKNTKKMEEMRPQLEKLQRQYANRSELYQKKMQDLYKENGYSPFAACLPTLLNLIFFIVVIGQFSTYSNYANFDVFCKMSEAYTVAVENYDTDHETNYFIKEDGINYIDLVYFSENNEAVKNFNFDIEAENDRYNATFTYSDSSNLKKVYDELQKGKDGLLYDYTDQEIMKEEGGVISFVDNLGEDVDGNPYTADSMLKRLCTMIVENSAENFVQAEIKEVGRQAAASEYRKYDLSFLWVKNIWSQDLPWENPIKKSFAQYNFVTSSGCIASCKSQCSGENNRITSVSEPQYEELTRNLTKEKSEPNGYLILVILSIGTMLLSQIVMSKMNKSQMELSTVDGENGTSAMTQKMMTWMMPIMFGFFSFMYTASFSIYMIVSSVFGLLSTLLINFLVDKSMERKAKQDAYENELVRMGKIKELEELKNKKGKKK